MGGGTFVIGYVVRDYIMNLYIWFSVVHISYMMLDGLFPEYYRTNTIPWYVQELGF